MKKLFVAIRKGDIKTVKELLEKKPELISCTAKQPPKNDHGQSPLQVAIKSDNFEIAEYLLDLGADVNFMESESCYEWRMPVVQDAIIAAVMCSRRNINFGGGYVVQKSTKEEADLAFHILQRMFEMGADINGKDSYGNSCLTCAVLQARQIIPTYDYKEKRVCDNRIVTDELKADLTRIFDLLLEKGSDPCYIPPNIGKPLNEFFKEEPIAQFFIK